MESKLIVFRSEEVSDADSAGWFNFSAEKKFLIYGLHKCAIACQNAFVESIAFSNRGVVRIFLRKEGEPET